MDTSDVIVLKNDVKVAQLHYNMQNSMYFLNIVSVLARTYSIDTSISSLQLICRNCFVYLSRPMGKPTICIGENKGADQLRGNREADQRLCFRYSDSTIPLLLKSEVSSCFQCLYRSVCVGPVRKPHCWFSHEVAHFCDYVVAMVMVWR